VRSRYERHLNGLIDLAEKEIHRTHWDRAFRELAWMYHHKFFPSAKPGGCIRRQPRRRLQKISGRRPHRNHHHGATHGLLPLLANHPPSIRAQIPDRARPLPQLLRPRPARHLAAGMRLRRRRRKFLQEANIRWFILDTHGVLHAAAPALRHLRADLHAQRHRRLRARFRFLAAGLEQARRLSRRPALPRFLPRHRFRPRFRLRQAAPAVAGQPRFHRHQVLPHHRRHAGEKRFTSATTPCRPPANTRGIFWTNASRRSQARRAFLDRPPIIVAPYDAELFGHWWYEGPGIPRFPRAQALQRPENPLSLITPGEYLHRHPTNQIATPGASSWGEEGYWRAWLNESNEWIYPHLQVAQERMTELARKFPKADRTARARPCETGRARTAAGAGQRLAVHFARRHQSRIRPPPREGPSAPLHRAARPADRHERGRKMAGRNRVPRQHFSRRGLELLEVLASHIWTMPF
jgi:1,4-alpha-glucan branching enzyme